MIATTIAWLKDFNDNYAQAVQALTPVIIFVFGIIGGNRLKKFTDPNYKTNPNYEANLSDAALYIKPIFRTLGKRYNILAVHQFEKSSDISGYTHLGQNSRPDQWKKLIKIKSSFLNTRFEVIPLKKDLILEVIISRDGFEKRRVIKFNK